MKDLLDRINGNAMSVLHIFWALVLAFILFAAFLCIGVVTFNYALQRAQVEQA